MTTSTTPAQSIVSEAQQQHFIVEDFVRLPKVSNGTWVSITSRRGSRAFLSDTSPVPFVINNDGVLSRQAAETFLSSFVQAEKAGPLEPKMFVLELGIGVGLFARFFLDAFKEMCARGKGLLSPLDLCGRGSVEAHAGGRLPAWSIRQSSRPLSHSRSRCHGPQSISWSGTQLFRVSDRSGLCF